MYLSLSIVLFRCLGKRPTSVSNLKDIVRIHSLMTYMDLIDYNIVGDTKVSLRHCFLSISKLIVGVIRTTGLYMNYQTFSNLLFRPLLRNFQQSIHIDLRDTKKISFVSVANNRIVLLFRKASNVCFQPKRRYKMVASRQVEIPFYRGIGRQLKRGFNSSSYWVNHNSLSAQIYCPGSIKRLGADLLEFVAPEIADVVSSRKISKTASTTVGRQTLKKTMG